MSVDVTTHRSKEALERGLVDDVVPAQDLTARAAATVTTLARVATATYQLTKEQRS